MPVNNFYFKDQNLIKFIQLPEKENLLKDIPNCIFKLKYNKDIGLYLEEFKDFKIPYKLYGNISSSVNRVLTSYEARDNNLGILLYGQAGGGKSLFAKVISKELKNKYKLPIIVIDSKNVELIPSFIEKINQPCVFLLDEFEKFFEKVHEQDFLLPILDGIYTSKHVFILTANDIDLINDYMIGRPGRILYSFEYNGLAQDVIEEYIDENLQNKEKRKDVIQILSSIKDLSFDIMQSFVLENNIFPEISANKLIDGFNVNFRTDYLSSDSYDFEVFIGDKPIWDIAIPLNSPDDEFSDINFNVNPNDISHYLMNPTINLGTLIIKDIKDGHKVKGDFAFYKLKVLNYISDFNSIKVLLEFDEEYYKEFLEEIKEFNKEAYLVLKDVFEKVNRQLKIVYTKKEYGKSFYNRQR